jgi:predicted acyltransferase
MTDRPGNLATVGKVLAAVSLQPHGKLRRPVRDGGRRCGAAYLPETRCKNRLEHSCHTDGNPGMSDRPAGKTERLLSLDAARGFTMFWIIGGGDLVHRAADWTGAGWLRSWSVQMTHAKWDGLHAEDLIFPFFMFLSGIAIPFALGGKIERGEITRAAALRKVLLRALTLVALGVLYNGAMASDATPRFPSVLGQIGLAYACAATLFLFCKKTTVRVAALFGILAVVTGAQLLIPVPGHGAGVLTAEGSINALIDGMLIPGKLHGGTVDPQGVVAVFSAITLTLAGALTGSALRHGTGSPGRRAGAFAGVGAAFLAVGALSWSAGYPCIKPLATATYDCLAIGFSLVAFAAFHAVIDLAKISRWSLPLRIIGMNSLAIYLAARFIPFGYASKFLFGRFAALSGAAGPVVIAAGVVAIELGVLWWLYRRKIFFAV